MNIGITGGIGVGKSIVSKIIELMGYNVFNSDFEAKSLINKDPLIKDQLIKLLGKEIYKNSILNKEVMAEKIFSNNETRKLVNEIVHPRVRDSFALFVSKQKNNIVFNESAILFETGSYEEFDKIILVTSPMYLRVSRIINRDKCSKQELDAKISSQWDDNTKIPLADFVILNDEKEPIINQIEIVLNQLTSV
ncbi:MAG: dephospho-CoA kinase [Crocinitomicaceae bacterium]|nr:dephospho-CoA kinase [Crocinitomicaceae bacterium]|tara:strand:+ start:45004 stop:45582 length:579 start_codon:yes stop_codon:yes gene_type:complete